MSATTSALRSARRKTPAVSLVRRAFHVRDHTLHVEFEDGTARDVDFGPYLRRHSGSPHVRPYVGAGFRQFRVEGGEIIWGERDMCFTPESVYTGRI